MFLHLRRIDARRQHRAAHLKCSDPHVQPELDYRYLAEHRDRKRLRDGMRQISRLCEETELRDMIVEQISLSRPISIRTTHLILG